MIPTDFHGRIDRLRQGGLGPLLGRGLKGLEKESLRVTPAGRIAQTPHPESLGSALTHPHITTDFSEALIELITPPFADAEATLDFLDELHRFVYGQIGDELLYASSMPCILHGEDDIPLARYGSSNIGRMKYIYRLGLCYRYGRAMQAIAGTHFNYSVPEAVWPLYQELCGSDETPRAFRDRCYFGLLRNVQRIDWLLLYLFGASPAMCRTFLRDRPELSVGFQGYGGDSLYRPYATSLRMSDVGYRNANQANLEISTRDLDAYVDSLQAAINTPSAAYRRIGVVVDGAYRQLNDHVLQVENEFYNSIRPKQPAEPGERPTLALRRRGVQYVEVRSLDLNPFEPLALHLDQMRFLEVFLLHCLFTPSPPIEGVEKQMIAANFHTVAICGRAPELRLATPAGSRLLRDWAGEILEQMGLLAALMDAGQPDRRYANAVARCAEAVADDTLTPSARILMELERSGQPFSLYAMQLTRAHAESFRARPLPATRLAQFADLAQSTLVEQAEIEAADRIPFDEYLRHYYAPG